MKRLLSIILIAVLAFGAFTATASAFFGTGVAVVAKDVSVIKSGLLGRKLCFKDGDFKSAFALDDFGKIKITALPSSTEGTLLLAGRRVREGQEITRRSIAAMVFVPRDKTIEEASFRFSLDGGAECICQMRFIDKINYAPRAGNEADTAAVITTQREIGASGKMAATDPEGDKLEYIVVSYPERGLLTLGAEGEYRYNPTADFVGYDRFTYVVRDEYGNYSEPTEVSLRVIERMSEIVYCDMTEAREYNAAVAMSALGIMGGRLIGDDYYFEPANRVTREEFVAMAMKSYGIKPSAGESYFDDNSEISKSLVGYIALAQRMGIIDGEYEGGRLTFSPKEQITVYEAADVISRMIGAEATEEELVYRDNGEIPVWARGSVEAMITMGILDTDRASLTAGLTRGSAADMLYKMINNI